MPGISRPVFRGSTAAEEATSTTVEEEMSIRWPDVAYSAVQWMGWLTLAALIVGLLMWVVSHVTRYKMFVRASPGVQRLLVPEKFSRGWKGGARLVSAATTPFLAAFVGCRRAAAKEEEDSDDVVEEEGKDVQEDKEPKKA